MIAHACVSLALVVSGMRSEPASVDLGIVQPGVAVSATFAVKNCSQVVRTLAKTSVSCPSCIEVVVWPGHLVPGQAGVVKVRITPDARPGPARWHVALHGDGGPPIRAVISGVVAGLAVDPLRIRLGEIGTDVPRTVSVNTRWFGSGHVEAIRVHVNPPGALRVIDTLGGRVVLEVPPGRTVGAFGATARVEVDLVDDAGSSTTVTVAVPIDGRVVNTRVDVTPRAVFLGSVRQGAVATAHLLVEHRSADELRVFCDIPGAEVVLDPAPASGVRRTIWLRYIAPNHPGLVEGAVRIVSGDPSFEIAAVPVVAFVHREGTPP